MSGRRAELQGFYNNSKRPGYLKVEEDGKVTWREGGRETVENIKIEFGDFKPAEEVLREASGIENYNFKLMILNEKNGKVEWTIYGIVSADGERLYFLDNSGTGVDIFPRISEEEAAELGWCLVQSQPHLTRFPMFRRGPGRPDISPTRSLHHPATCPGETHLVNWSSGSGQVYNCSTACQRQRYIGSFKLFLACCLRSLD